jgi:hypothetical protein
MSGFDPEQKSRVARNFIAMPGSVDVKVPVQFNAEIPAFDRLHSSLQSLYYSSGHRSLNRDAQFSISHGQ